MATSQLPVEGDGSERIPRFSLRKRYRNSVDWKRQVWMGVALSSPPLLVFLAVMLFTVLTRPT